MNKKQCVACKGVRMLCGRTKCPMVLKISTRKKLESALNENELVGESPTVFVGSYNYPKVFIGPLTGKNVLLKDETSGWYGTPLDTIIEHRTSLFRGKKPVRIDSAKNPSKELETLQEIAMSEKNVDTDLVFKKKPRIEVTFSDITAPYGPAGETQRLTIESNPKIPRATDKVVNDEMKAIEGIINLYNNGITLDEIQKILSTGLLGFDKKLVPTRWSITATDDTIAKRLLEEIRDFEEINEYLVFSSTYLDNHFEILLTPGKWSFEQIEYYQPKKAEEAVMINDYEHYKPRTKYADNVAGGYYAGRLGVCEYLCKNKRQATAIIVREIGPDYYAPVGVWEVRENVRSAMKSKPMRFQTLKELLEHIEKKFKAGKDWQKNSEILKIINSREAFRKWVK